LYAGSITQDEDSKLSFQQLAVTGSKNSGTIETAILRQQMQSPGGQVFGHVRSSNSYIIGAQIEGEYIDDDELLLDEDLTAEETATEESDATSDETADDETANGETANGESEEDRENDTDAGEAAQIKAVVVADIDWIIPAFFMIRESGDGQVIPATQNVTFILNIIDALAGDDRFIEIRKRVRKHRTLTKIDDATRSYRENANKQEDKFIEQMKEEAAQAQKTFDEEVAAVSNTEGLSQGAKDQRIAIARQRAQKRLQADMKSIETRQSKKLKQIEYDLEQEVRGVQGLYKKYAILIPPIPPLLVALYVFFRRRETEREGIVKERLR